MKVVFTKNGEQIKKIAFSGSQVQQITIGRSRSNKENTAKNKLVSRFMIINYFFIPQAHQ